MVGATETSSDPSSVDSSRLDSDLSLGSFGSVGVRFGSGST